jgi:hypothetical protein
VKPTEPKKQVLVPSGEEAQTSKRQKLEENSSVAQKSGASSSAVGVPVKFEEEPGALAGLLGEDQLSNVSVAFCQNATSGARPLRKESYLIACTRPYVWLHGRASLIYVSM